jgi:hypothetical protein
MFWLMLLDDVSLKEKKKKKKPNFAAIMFTGIVVAL